MLKRISERQSLLKDALVTKSRYPLMDRGDKNTYDNFTQMSKAFEGQKTQAKLSQTIASHLIDLYDNFLDKLQALYMVLSEFNFDRHDENGVMNDCPSLDWCKRVQEKLSDVLEFPFHQQFLNKVLFADPQYKYDYSQFESHLDNASGASTDVLAPNDSTLVDTKMSSPDALPSSLYDKFFHFNAYGSSISSTSTSSSAAALTSTVNLSYKAMNCRTVMNVLTEEWKISNRDNSLPGILLDYFTSNDFPTAYGWKLLDTNFFCEALTSSMDENHALNDTFGPGSSNQFLIEFMEMIYNWIQGVEQNMLIVKKEKRIIDTVLESSCCNLKIADEQLELHGSIDEDDLLAMIESGNITKATLAKIPSVGHKNIFSHTETKDLFKKCGC